MIHVTKSFLPPIQEYTALLNRAWNKSWLTNRGELVLELEDKLKTFLQVDNIIATTNGTLPLMIAIKALNLKGEIITTPFSYVATASSIVWQDCKPIFADIDPRYLTIDPGKIENKITSNTSAILATHVYGNPCDVEAISSIAKKNNLKVIYDAAHCFGVKYKDESIFNYGDISTCSFHATKLFHTGEGGAIFAKDQSLIEKIFFHHNFGHDGPTDYFGIGINAKMSELQAAMGLAVLPYIDRIISARQEIDELYRDLLNHLDIIHFQLRPGTEWNFSYFPILLQNESQVIKIKQALEMQGINCRRYFYPTLNMLPYVEHSECTVAESVSRRIICLPLFHSLGHQEVERISNIILNTL